MGTKSRSRRYVSKLRQEGAEATRESVLSAARRLFVRYGIDRVPIDQIAEAAGVASSTIYAIYRSKEGILRALIETTLFGERFNVVRSMLDGVTDPARQIALSAQVARTIYEAESSELGLIRGSSAFSSSLRKMEQELEKTRFNMQEDRFRLLFKEGRQRKGLTLDEARRILWMYTSRDVYRMLVSEGGWTPDRYQQWLAATLVEALVEP